MNSEQITADDGIGVGGDAATCQIERDVALRAAAGLDGAVDREVLGGVLNGNIAVCSRHIDDREILRHRDQQIARSGHVAGEHVK